MAVQRRLNLLGQQRVDVPHIRALESAVVADMDLLAGTIMAGQRPLVVKGFELNAATGLSTPATALQLTVAGGVLLHPLATEAGTIFHVPDSAAPEVLSVSNSKVIGGFTANTTNYVGIDLLMLADDSTADISMFLDAASKLEVPKTVPQARTLDFRIKISTSDFGSTPTVCPVARVVTDSAGAVVSIDDCRNMYFRLGTGGSAANRNAVFSFLNGRQELSIQSSVSSPNSQIFLNGDKAIGSDKEWRDAVMTRLWEVGGGEAWFSATSDRDVKLGFTSSTLPSGMNAEWDVGTSTLEWQGLLVTFANSVGWFNQIEDDSAVLADGQCLYVDIDRTKNRNGSIGNEKLIPAVGDLDTLGSPLIPGSRVIVAWRVGSDVFLKDYPFEVNRGIGVPPPLGDPLNVLFEGPSGVTHWGRIYDYMIVSDLNINSFSPTTALVEKGVNVVDPTFSATYNNGTPTTLSLEDDYIPDTGVHNVVATPNSFASAPHTYVKSTLGSNPAVVFSLTADAGAPPDTETCAITWTRHFYWGLNASPSPTLNEAFVKGLPNKNLQTNRNKNIVTAPVSQYLFFALPAYYGNVASIVDNLINFNITGAYTKVATVSVTTEAGAILGENYDIYRSNQALTGNVNITVG